MSALDAQLGTKTETVVGTAVTVDTFHEFVSEGLEAQYATIDSNGLRPGRRYRSLTRSTKYVDGAEGDIELEVGSKGFGFWLYHMLGAKAAPVGPTDSAYTHVFTPGALAGLSFTTQIGRPFSDGSSVQPFTYSGCKINTWELSNSNDGNLMATLGVVAMGEDTATALATASYPTGLETFSWAGGSVSIGGVSFELATEVSVSGNNNLNTDLRYLRNSTTKGEARENGYREGEFSLTAEFDSLTQRNRVASATVAGAIAEIVLRWEGKALIGATTYPSLEVVINARFDEFSSTVGGPESLMQELSGVYGDTGAIEITYVTTDATVS